MSRWRIENDDGWFIVYKDGVEVASHENGDRMADVLNDAFHDANARISELTKEIEKLQEKVKQMYKAGTAMYDQIDEVRKAEHQSLDGRDRYADRGWLFATSGMDDEDGEWWGVSESYPSSLKRTNTEAK